jgi:hypothetical protein
VGDERTPDLGAHRVQADRRKRIERDFIFDLSVQDRLVAAVARLSDAEPGPVPDGRAVR